MSLTEKELEALRESEARSRIVVETLADAVVTIDESSVIRYANPAAERIFGYERDELVGLHMTALMPDYLRRLHEEGIHRYIETGVKHISWEGVELPGLHKSGREVALEVSFGEFALGGRRYFTGVARDITERKRLDARLAAQYEVTRALAEVSDFNEAVPRILRAVCEALGWEAGALWALVSASVRVPSAASSSRAGAGTGIGAASAGSLRRRRHHRPGSGHQVLGARTGCGPGRGDGH